MARPKRTAKNAAPKTTKKTPAKKSSAKRKASDDGESTNKMQRTDSLNTQLQQAIDVVKKQSIKKKFFKLDAYASSLGGAQVLKDYSCMLNQTNINHNNNKFYVIQLIEQSPKDWDVFTRWGRVGETGQLAQTSFKNKEDAIKEFEKKFKAKTANDWKIRNKFQAKSGKYTLLEMSDDEEEEEEEEKCVTKKTKKSSSSAVCDLHPRTIKMLELILSEDMFRGQMADMNLDVKKMPLGKLSKSQIAKGLEVLIELERALDDYQPRTTLAELSSKFYTLVPHSFGRTVPPIIDSKDIINQKKEMMMVLSDIELAMSVQAKVKDEEDSVHPLTKKYRELGCNMEWIPKDDDEYKMIHKYSTACNSDHMKLVDVWKVTRKAEPQRFAVHDDIDHRKLLWHGTNVAVVAAILNSGLRIMPHSGGRVGKGIYLASEHSKSAGYVWAYHNTFEGESNVSFMFLVEAALGKVKVIKRDDCTLKAAPKGFHSVQAIGSTEPEKKKDIVKEYDGHKVIVPVGKPRNVPSAEDSSFGQSEYLVYQESQARLRYVLKFTG